MNNQVELSIIVVNYQTKELLFACLSSVLKTSQDLDIEVIVIDNNSRDDSTIMIKNLFPSVILIENKVNLGFSAASNLGLKIMKGCYALLLNPDTEIPDGSLQGMLEVMQTNKNLGILGCKIIDPEGHLQRSAFPVPSLLCEISDALPKLKLEKILPARFTYRCFDNIMKSAEQPFEVGWVTGACLMIRRETIQDIGLLDENFFLFSEDVDWCIRALKSGWQVMCHPVVHIVHQLGGSSKPESEETAIRIEHSFRRRFYFARKHFGIGGWIIIKLLLVFYVLCGLIFVSLNLKSEVTQAQRKMRIKGYRAALASVFREKGITSGLV